MFQNASSEYYVNWWNRGACGTQRIDSFYRRCTCTRVKSATTRLERRKTRGFVVNGWPSFDVTIRFGIALLNAKSIGTRSTGKKELPRRGTIIGPRNDDYRSSGLISTSVSIANAANSRRFARPFWQIGIPLITDTSRIIDYLLNVVGKISNVPREKRVHWDTFLVSFYISGWFA